MEEARAEFRKRRLESLTKEQLIRIILHPENNRHFQGLFRSDLEKQSHDALVNVIYRVPSAFIDNNFDPDFNHFFHARAFEQWTGRLKENMDQRMALLNSMSVQQLIAVVMNPMNATYFKGVNARALAEEPREVLMKLIARRPEAIVDGDPMNRSYNPFFWRARPNQADHIQRLIRGLSDPTNEARVAWDGSDTGKGKTASSILTAIGLRVRFLLIICPDAVIKKWHDALSPLGLFDYRLCTYSGIKGTSSKAPVQWAKYKPDPDRLTISEDLEWLRITATGKTGKASHQYDWSFLPDREQNNDLGGCLVIWDEVQNAKGRDSKIGVCFNEFIYYLHREKRKYIRSLFLSGSIMEAPKDLPYLVHAYGYIAHPAPAELNAFIRNTISPSFKQLIGIRDWEPEYDRLTDGHDKLIRFIRTVVGRENRFSQIPDGISYITYILGFIRQPTQELMKKFRDVFLIPKFRQYIDHDGQNNWRPEFDLIVEPDHYVRAWLSVLASEPKYAEVPIQEILDSTFDNPISFQGIQMQEEEIERFKKVNREIEDVMTEIANGDRKFDGNTLGVIQRALSDLEVFKLTPFSDLARRILTTPYENGAQGSVVISMTRNASVRHFAWRLEAVLWIQALEKQAFNSEEEKVAYLISQRDQMIQILLEEYERYAKAEKIQIAQNQKLQLKSSFKILKLEELQSMSFEDVTFEYNKWIKYLDAKNFNYVCIYVGDLGINPTDFDLDSPDEKDWIKESKAMNRTTKEEMKALFQSNQRRVFITNILISREGIDLHDTSDDGMFPRTAIISPGIVARYLLQMLGRFVREGQTSNAVRIIGFIDNVRGIKSWEAVFMTKLNAKIRSIQMMHSGESKLDIQENIDKDGTSILMQIVNDMKAGKAQSMQTGDSVFNQVARENQQLEAHTPALGAPTMPVDTIQRYLAKQYVASKKSPGSKPASSVVSSRPLLQQNVDIGVRQKPKLLSDIAGPVTQTRRDPPILTAVDELATTKLMIKVNRGYIYFDLKHNANRQDLERVISQTLISAGINPNSFLTVGGISAESGVLLYRPALLQQEIREQEVVAAVLRAVGLQPDGQNVPEDAFASFNFTPDLSGTPEPEQEAELVGGQGILHIIVESENSLLVFPREPILSAFPELLLQPDLTVTLIGSDEVSLYRGLGDGLRFNGSPFKIMAAYYSIMTIALFENVGFFSSINKVDQAGILAKSVYSLKNGVQNTATENNVYLILAHKDIVKLLPIILSAAKQFHEDLAANNIFKDYTESSTNLAKVIVANPRYRAILDQLIGNSAKVLSGRRP